MSKLKKLLLGIGMFASAIGISRANEINQLVAPKPDEIDLMTANENEFRKTATGDYTFVTVPVTQNTHQNALNLEQAGKTGSTGTLIVKLPNAEYDLNGIDAIKLNFRDDVRYRATSSSIPTQIGRINDFPSTGAFIRDELSLASSITLENLTFHSLRDEPLNFLSLSSDKIRLLHCYFRGTNNNRGITISRSGTGSSITVENCLFTSFSYGAEIGRVGSNWRKNIFKNNLQGFIGTAGADYGTTSSPGNNLFWRNRKIVGIYAGTGYPMQWGWFYNKDGIQLTKLEDILALIEDYRTTTTPSPSNFKSPNSVPRKLDVGNDILIYPFHTTPHPLIPAPTGAKRWKHYR